MRLSKIGSVNTYTKCLKQLDEYGFIRYEPSYNPHRGSLIYLYTFDNSSDKGTDTGSEKAVIPFKNNSNPVNNETETNLDEQAKKIYHLNDNEMNKKEKLREKFKPGAEIPTVRKKDTGKNERSGYGPDIPPIEEHVKIYFDEKGYPPVEAEKFFNYFQSNGWLVGGRSKMKDWKAAARNWMLNAQKYNGYAKDQRNNQAPPRGGGLHTGTTKDYSEPL